MSDIQHLWLAGVLLVYIVRLSQVVMYLSLIDGQLVSTVEGVNHVLTSSASDSMASQCL